MSTIWLEFLGGGVQERYYDAGDVRTRVLESGDGPTLLMLHGTGGHAEAYCRNIVPLSRDFRVIAVDMLGHGYTGRPDVSFTLDDFADHLAALADAVGAERVHVSGESLGAMVAAWFGIKYPERTGKVVMNTGTLARPGAEGMAEYADFEQRTRALVDQELTREAVRRRMEWLVADPARMTDELVECRYRIYSQPGMRETVATVMSSVLGMIRGEHGAEYFAPETLSRLQRPAMVLWTRHNPGQDVELARETSKSIPQHEFHVLNESGHWPQFEEPETVNQLHRDFLLRDDAV
jgi:2-hydroxy-6-oxonona-2,4-dienedioate hydrolase